MLKAKCVEKIRNKNNTIVSYKLQDTQGNILTVSPHQLKQAIKANQIDIINLKLTSDNRLIATQIKLNKTIKQNKTSVTLKREYITPLNNQNNKSLSFKIKVNLSNIIKKSQLLGYTTQKLEENLYLLESNTQLLIATDLDKMSLPADCKELFSWSSLKSIDFTNVDTSNVTDMSHMFHNCKTQHLDLSSFNTQNVTDMSWMFSECQAQNLELHSFNTQNVTNMASMFYNCQAQQIDLSNFNTQNVTNMSSMFFDCQAQQLDLSSFNTQNITSISYMFYNCQAQQLDLSRFNTSKVTNMSLIFSRCQAQKIIVNRKGMENILSNKKAFEDCTAKIEIKD